MTLPWRGKKLADQFQKKTWANELALRRGLYLFKSKESDSFNRHIKSETEIFEYLSVIGNPNDKKNQDAHF